MNNVAQYRVTYIEGFKRRTRNVTEVELRYLQRASYNGIRVTSYRKL